MPGRASQNSLAHKIAIGQFGHPWGYLSVEQRLWVRRIANRDYYARNKETVCARTTEYRKKNQEWFNAYNREYRRSKPEQRALHYLLSKRWRARNPERAKLKRMRGGAVKRGIHFELNDTQAFIQWHRAQPKVCTFCGIPEEVLSTFSHENFRAMTIDRIDSTIGYRLDNLCLACYKCNTKKGNDIPFDVMREIGEKYLKPLWMKRVEVCHS